MSTRHLVALVLCTAGGLSSLAGVQQARAQQQSASHPETQKLLFENSFVRVFDIRVPAGTFEPTHSHARGVTIALSDYDNETKSVPDGRVNRGHSKFGDVRWAEPVTHEARNVGTTEQHVVRIELKTADTAASSSRPSDDAELSRLEADWNEAHVKGDADALDRLAAADLVVTVPEMPVMTKASAFGVLRAGGMKFDRYETSDTRMRVYGRSAIVTGRLHRTRANSGRTFDDDWLFTKTYVHAADGRWQVAAFHASNAVKELR
jgi:ketosteroid isomerase-like protein